jgi:hypothetical protein
MLARDRRHEGDELARRAGIQPIAQRNALGNAEAEAGWIARDMCPGRNSAFVPLMEQQF